jgi:hypothetical protein
MAKIIVELVDTLRYQFGSWIFPVQLRIDAK